MMNTKERRRLTLLGQVRVGQITLVGAASALGLSYRQAKRVYGRFKVHGDAGLVHGLRGRVSNRRSDPGVRRRALALYREHYGDFGPTLAAEYLARDHGLRVKPGTLRRWLLGEGLWQRRRRSSRKRLRRERRACFGELVQMDGSPHAWFEGRGEPCVAMVMVDDATNWTHVRFVESETTVAAMRVFGDWCARHGLPRQVYPDRHSIYRVNTKQAREQYDRTGKRPLTQFGRAMEALGVGLICANSPQAKGRVERTNGILQDRLIKALRLAGISDLDQANAFLEQSFLPDYNARFAKAPADRTDAHVPYRSGELDAALCMREDRTVGKDQCIGWAGQVLQLTPGRRSPSLGGKKVEVVVRLDGTLEVRHGRQRIPHTVLAARPKAAVAVRSLAERVADHAPSWKPPADHPWRRAGVGSDRRPRLRPCSAPSSSPAARSPALRKAAIAI